MTTKLVWLGMPPTDKSFRPYVTAIGQAAIAWNGLHEALRELFLVLMGDNDYLGDSTVWHSLRSDRSQRQLIIGVVKSRHETGELSDQIRENIGALLKQCNTVADARDNVIHAPLSSEKGRIVPDAKHGNPRASNLLNKDLLTEFRWCRDAALVLTDSTYRMVTALTDPSRFPWPKTPALPNRGVKKNHQGRHHQPQKR